MRGLAYHQKGLADKALTYLLRASQNLPVESPLSQNLLPLIQSLENNYADLSKENAARIPVSSNKPLV